MPIDYDGMMIESGYRIDMLIDDSVIIENKTVDDILPIHEAQLLTYMRSAQGEIGLSAKLESCPDEAWHQTHGPITASDLRSVIENNIINLKFLCDFFVIFVFNLFYPIDKRRQQ